VFNWAITEELTDNYPFRRFKLRYAETDKRSLTLSQLRTLLRLNLTGYAREYRDIFLLSLLLLGINITDLHALRPCDYADGRIRYRRAKTGRAYDIKVEPEAAALIEQYRGQQHLLSFADRYRSARDYTQHINAGLKRLLPDPPFTSLSTYWARHTWATLAFNELSASTDDIAAALGHQHGSRITAIYINPDSRKVDALNRRMLDLIFAL
jgi:integrase